MRQAARGLGIFGQDHPVPGQAFQAPRQFKLQDDGPYCCYRQLAAPGDLVNSNGFRAQQGGDLVPGAMQIVRGRSVLPPERCRLGETGLNGAARGEVGWKVAEYVVRCFGEVRALADEVVAASSARVQRRAGDGEDLPPGLSGKALGEKRAGADGGLDDHEPSVSPAMMRLRLGKCRPIGAVPSGASATTAPVSAMRRWSSAFSGG